MKYTTPITEIHHVELPVTIMETSIPGGDIDDFTWSVKDNDIDDPDWDIWSDGYKWYEK